MFKEKKAISFYAVGFSTANDQFKRDQPFKLEVFKEYKKLTGQELENFADPVTQAYNYFEKSVVDNVMNLDAKTYCELKKIDFNGLKVALMNFKNIDEPQAENYTIFTTSVVANERLAQLQTLITAFKKFATANELDPNLLVKSLQGRLNVDGTVAAEYINR
jgi:hypothetical protein